MHYVEDVQDVLKHIGPAVLVGHSMGGLIAQIVADQNPEIPGVVLVNSAAPRGVFPGSWATLSRYWKLRYLINPLIGEPLHPHGGDVMSLVLNNTPPEDAKRVLSHLVPEAGRAVRETTLWPLRGRKLEIRCPILVIGGKRDRLTPIRIQKAIARKYGARYAEFPGAHMLPIQPGWEAVIRFILNWAAEHVS